MVDRYYMHRVAGIALLFTAVLVGAQEQRLRHEYRVGERYRIVGVSDQTIYVNDRLVGSAQVLTRMQLEVIASDRQGGSFSATYQLSDENSSGDAFRFEREFTVQFQQDRFGRLLHSSDRFAPTVRGVPTFPERAIAPGATWNAPGLEIYDFRNAFGLDEPVEVPIDVGYRYRGRTEIDGNDLHHIEIRYAVLHRPAPGGPAAEVLRLLTAEHDQNLYWDAVAGRAVSYDERFTVFLQTADGQRLEYRGSADGRVVGAPPLDRDGLAQRIEEAIEDSGIEDAAVRQNEDGVVITLENIRFAPDSAEIVPSERVKIDWPATIVQQYPDRDLLIVGHTALAGTPRGRQRLSQARAAAVAGALIELGVRTRDRILVEGRGAREPLAPNDTDEGRSRNRRVEITILEN